MVLQDQQVLLQQAQGTSAFDAGNFADDAPGYRDKAKDWAQSGLPPDPGDKDSNSSKSWSTLSKNWAKSSNCNTNEPAGQGTKSTKSWSGEAESYRDNPKARAQSSSTPGGSGSGTKSSKTWSTVSNDWAESTGAPGGGSTKSSKSWSTESKNWAQSTSAPGGGTTKSAKTWASDCSRYRDSARAWAENTTAPDGGTAKSAKTIVNEFQISLSSEIIVSAVKIGFLNGSPTGGGDQATFMNSTQVFPELINNPNLQVQKHC